MTTSSTSAWRLLAASSLLVLALSSPSSAEDGAALLDETGSGIVPINDEKLIRVRGIKGQLILQPGVKGEVEFQAFSMKNGTEEIPVAVWTDGAAFTFTSARGRETIPASLRIRIPAGMRVRLDLEETEARVEAVDAELTVNGRQIRFQARTLRRRAAFEVEGGAVSVNGSEAGVSVRGRGLDLTLDGIGGPASVVVNGGSAKLAGLVSGLDGTFNGTRVAIDGVSGLASLQITGGNARIARLKDGGTLALTGCRLMLEQISGALSIESDSEVRFSNCQAALHIHNSAGAVVGQGNAGLVEVTTQGAVVELSQLQGEARVRGDSLQVKLEGVGTLDVSTTSSSVSVNGAATATVENERGDVVIRRVEGAVAVKSRQGNVELLGMQGPVTVEAAGDHVVVEWSSLEVPGDCRIENNGGDVTVRILSGACTIDAKSGFGRIESSLEGVQPAQDERSVQGVVGGIGGRTIVIRAAGDVLLAGAGEPIAQPGQNP